MQVETSKKPMFYQDCPGLQNPHITIKMIAILFNESDFIFSK